VLMAGVLARQRDTDLTRQWEIAVAAHFDTYGLRAGYVDDGTLSPQELHRLQRPQLSPRGYHTSSPVNGAPQHHYVLQAALASLEDWARGGPPAPAANVFDTHKFQPLRLQRDSHGIVRGGVRTPWVDAPVATYSGLGQRVRGFGILFGSTRAWSAREVATRYPGGPDQYRSEFDAALGASVDAGFLLPEDREEATALGHLSWPDVNEETP
jgi:hypothetical protein